MVEFILFCIPSLIYVAVQSRRKDQSLQSALRRVGASWGTAAAYGWACLCLVPLLVSSWLLLGLIPEGVLSGPDLLIARFTSFALVIGAILRAVGEEVFFRGLLAGVLLRRLGFSRAFFMRRVDLVPGSAGTAEAGFLWCGLGWGGWGG